ncbi:MAG: hypothetical protein M3R71_05230, partial [Actinomycetota bacterium]|nr:hypothetical protein [Actinomycetota bacterium]
MPAAAAQLLFVAEFVTMLVAAAGLILVAFRPSLTSAAGARFTTLAGFLATGAAAFAHGSRLYQTEPSAGLSTARIGGGLLLLAGSLWWTAGARSRWSLRAGVAVGLVAAIGEAAGGQATVVDMVLILGSALIGVALTFASRRSIAARVGVGAAGTLLLVVIVLSLALSSVISSSVQQDLLVRLASQAKASAAQILDTSNQAIKDARFTAGDLVGYFRADNPDPLVQLGASGDTASAVAVGQRLDQLAELYPVGGFAYADATGDVVASSGGLRPDVAVAALHLFTQPSCDAGGVSSVVEAQGAIWAVGVAPECVSGSTQRLGEVLAVTPIDSAFLGRQRAVDPTLSLAIVGATEVLASSAPSGQLPPTKTLLRQRSPSPSTRVVSSRFFAVQPIAAVGTGASPALVLSTA